MRTPLRPMLVLAVPALFGAAACLAQSATPETPKVDLANSAAASGQLFPRPAKAAEPASDQSAVSAGPAAPASVSQVRIVRLSQAEGTVLLDRNTGQQFEQAFANLPIVSGEKLKTAEGVAEVEFEDNSSLRITPNSMIEFPTLGRQASGATTTAVRMVSGNLYVNLINQKNADAFSLMVGNRTITLAPDSHMRVDVTPATATAPASATLAMFGGSATVSDPSGSMIVAKKKAVTFDPAGTAAPVLAKADGEQMFDKWDKNAVDYHKQRAAISTFAGSSPYSYGLNDLAYYGSFVDLGGGCGSMWRPYLANAAFDPYGSGVWSYYPGAGYSWVSPYPWGWTPYHSGSWAMCNGSWGWRPGTNWNALANQPAAVRVIGRGHLPVAPVTFRPGQPTLIGVNVRDLPVSRVDQNNKFVFRGDSAGIGVPRGVFNMEKISHAVVEHGTAVSSVSMQQAERGLIPVHAPAATLTAAHTAPVAISDGRGVGSAHPASGMSRPSSGMESSSVGMGMGRPSIGSAPSHGGGSMGGGAHH